MALIKIKQINNSPAATGGLIVYDGTANVWSNNDDGAIQTPSGTTGNRPTGVNGMLRYNTTLNCLEAYIDGSWVCLVDTDTIGTFQTLQITGADSETSEPMAFITDTTRSNKILSIESSTFLWAEASVSNHDWIQIGNAIDSSNGYIMPYDGTVIRATVQTESGPGASDTMELDLYINNSNEGAILSLTGTGDQQDENTDLNLDFSAGDKLRMRGDGDTIGDTIATIWVKWRSA